jgi:3-dehydroquinate synthase
MSNFAINSSKFTYTVKLIPGNVNFDKLNFDFYIVDSRFKSAFSGRRNCYFVDSHEGNKNLITCDSIIEEMTRSGVNRQSCIAVIGGGLVQDLGTLTAALYMRGIKWVYLPTTLMAMMDSCLGGKSSINSGGFKNIIGNFYPPNEILIYSDFVKSLAPIEIASGLLEGVKICYARDASTFYDFCATLKQIFVEGKEIQESTILDAIRITLLAKKWFVEIDEHDVSERQLLNFGHTFGHALEAATDFRVPHGVAIGIGMLAALDFFQSTNLVMENSLRSSILEIMRFGCVESQIFEKLDVELFIKTLRADKKHSKNQYFFIVSNEGKLQKLGFDRSTAIEVRAHNSLKYAMMSLDK